MGTTLVNFNSNNLKLNSLEVIFSNDESISSAEGSKVLLEVRNQVSLSNVTSHTFNGIRERQDMNFKSIRYITSRLYLDGISHTDSQISSDTFVSADFIILHSFILTSDDSSKGFLSLFTFHNNVITLEDV